VQRYGAPGNNEVLIGLDIQETSEQDLSNGKDQIKQALESNAVAGKQDLNNTSSLAIKNYLLEKDPLQLGSGTEANPRYTAIAQAIVDYRDKTKGGVLGSIEELKTAADPAVVTSLSDNFLSRTLASAMSRSWGRRWDNNCASRRSWRHCIRWRNADLPGLPL